MGHIEGASRDQRLLFPDVLDDYIAAENPVRFIEAFVDSLDRDALGFRRVQPATTGRPSYHPGDLLKLYIYGYMHRIRSSRRLEQETPRNVARLWLLRTLHPDFKTIADFRQDKAPAFKHVFRALTLLCKEWGLCGADLVAIDGSQFQAVNNTQRNVTQAKLRDLRHAVDAKLEHYPGPWMRQTLQRPRSPRCPPRLYGRPSSTCASARGAMSSCGPRWRRAAKARCR